MPADNQAGDWRAWRANLWTFVKWCLIAIALLFAAGLGARALKFLMQQQSLSPQPPFSPDAGFLWTLFWFSLGGGATIGLLIFAWQIARTDPLGKLVALAVLLVLVFGVVIWPTPYKYYRAKNLDWVVRITRIAGTVCYFERVPTLPEPCPVVK